MYIQTPTLLVFFLSLSLKNGIIASMENTQIKYASLYARVIANSIDNMIIGILTFLIVYVTTFSSFQGLSLKSFSGLITSDLTQTATFGTPEAASSVLFFIVSLIVVYTLMSLIYFQLTLAGAGSATVGMELMKLKLSKTDGAKPKQGEVLMRNILFIALKAIYIGAVSLLTIGIGQKKQALHDMPLDTIVVSTKK